MTKKHTPPQGTDLSPEGAPAAGATGGDKSARRLTARRKAEIVLEVLSGGSLEAVSRKHGIPMHRLASWRNSGLFALEMTMKTGSPIPDPKAEKKELMARIGSMAMENELLREKISRLENGVPFRLRK